MDRVLDFGNSNSSTDYQGMQSHLGSGVTPASQRNILETRGKRHKSKRTQDHESTKCQKQLETIRISLEHVIDSVVSGNDESFSFARVNREVIALSTYKHSEQARLSDYIFRKLNQEFENLQSKLTWDSLETGSAGQTFLRELNAWDDKLKCLSRLFIFLDRVYLFQHTKKKPIRDHGLRLFASALFDSSSRCSLLEQVLKDLHLNIINRSKSEHSDWYNYDTLRQFAEYYERLIFEEHTSYYFISDIFLSNYELCKEDWWEDPRTFVSNIFDSMRKDISFMKALGLQDMAASFAKEVLRKTIIPDLSEVLSSCVPALMEDEREFELGILTKLLHIEEVHSNCNNVKQVAFHLRNYVAAKTIELIKYDAFASKDLLPEVVKLRLKLSESCSRANLHAPGDFDFEVRSAISNILSSPEYQNNSVLMFSKYCEAFFKSKDADAVEFKKNIQVFFKLLQNKGKFIKIYERDLSKRLLLGKSFNYPLEFDLVDNLLHEVGDNLDGTNLKAMIQDVKQSDTEFRHDYGSAEIFPLVLKKSNWPAIPKQATELKIPPELDEILVTFTEKFRQSDAKGEYKNLDWSNYLLHQLTISVNFDKGPKELQVNLLQAIVILQFSEHDTLSFAQFVEETRMEQKLLKRVIASLSSSKFPFLIEDNDGFSFNYAFWDKAAKLRPPMAREKEAVVEEAFKKAERRDRDDEITAAVCNILKQKGSILYPELMGQVLMRLKPRGEVSITDIKRRVEYLITQHFAKRSEDGQTLHYIP
ncbi:uncharacterized protein CXQ87_000259 [Candidozyma duobushaemuli]|uniref:Cullin family profile domain-containing protein n=2 Tax=Candidozyma TaxID=3303203 RepID=A0ABX8HZR3_9ASCO|nr:uncharacterized protein CXQ87_000259 [[Candida] duobushaemulonis]PVH17374.1 hypothetical protein CXQ87_000259 [[Candida] duobushaemulonis]QWU86017.1 hypothetical protein CA3LBN_000235 [[Candida] haemuloni]